MVQIVDASVAIKWFVDEEGTTSSLKILEAILQQPELFAVPELFFFELNHVLNRIFPKFDSKQIELFEIVVDLGWSRFPFSSLMGEKARHFQGLGLSGYDASYAALASMLNGKWITFDKQAHIKIQSLKISRLIT